MKDATLKWIKVQYNRMINSISFYPIIIALLFLGLVALMVSLDYSATGKDLKADMKWLRLKDASTARSIISAIAAGVISLTVFSFSMVMIVLNQAASQMTNRVLNNLIGNRFQQIVLGIYIGTIVYSLTLLSTIRDIDSGIYIPSLSIIFLIILTIGDIFLFIYFLHYITNSVKYQTIIHRVYDLTFKSMKKSCRLSQEVEMANPEYSGAMIFAKCTGVYQGFNKNEVLDICKKEDISIHFNYPVGSFVLEGIRIATLSKQVDEQVKDKLNLFIEVQSGDAIDNSYHYGIRQLVEVAVKGLSPGINDPGTAIESFRALSGILLYRLRHFPDNMIKDENGRLCIVTVEKTFEEIFKSAVLPIWDYGKDDRMLRNEIYNLLTQLLEYIHYPIMNLLMIEVKKRMDKEGL